MDNKTTDIKQFFDSWNLYKKIIDNNYMAHKDIFSVLRSFLNKNLKSSFSILDLGCGDVFHLAEELKKSHVEYYCGVDISGIALSFAKKNMQSVNCKKHFIEGNILEETRKIKKQFDIILAGYSIHHFTFKQKNEFVKQCRKIIKPGGYFLIYDLVNKQDETRDEYIHRLWETAKNEWGKFNAKELPMLHDHIFDNDYPEPFEALKKIGKNSGFKQLTSLFRDDKLFYEFCCFEIYNEVIF